MVFRAVSSILRYALLHFRERHLELLFSPWPSCCHMSFAVGNYLHNGRMVYSGVLRRPFSCGTRSVLQECSQEIVSLDASSGNETSTSEIWIGCMAYASYISQVLVVNRGCYITARGYEFYLRVFNSISHE